MKPNDVFEKVHVVDADGNHSDLDISPTVKIIGIGSRASIASVLSKGGDAFAVKKFLHSGQAARAMGGYAFLQSRLPSDERARLVPKFFIEYPPETALRVFMSLLNTDAWVVSMGQNYSSDRDSLRVNPRKQIPNFNEFVKKFLDAMESAAQHGLAIGPDVYFFTISHETGAMGHVYADTESASGDGNLSSDSIPLMNLYWAAGALNDFLHACVKDPQRYLVRLHQEVLHRMRGYPDACDLQDDVRNVNNDFRWPQSSIREWLLWYGDLVRRYIRQSWES